MINLKLSGETKVKKFLILALIFVAASSGLEARSTVQVSSGSRPAVQARPAQSPELAEAEKLSTQVVALYKAAKYDEALPLARQALRIREGALPADDARIISALNNLAFVLVAKENFGEAKTTFARSLAASETKFGIADPRLADIIVQLGIAYHRQSDNGKAVELMQRAADIREKAHGLNDSRTIETLYTLADLYQLQRKYGKAEQTLLRIINAKEQSNGARRAGLDAARSRYLALLMLDGREKEAEAVLAKMEAESSDPLQPAIGGVLNGKAILLAQPAYPSEAKAMGAQGTVPVKVLVDELGRVVDATAESGPQALRKAAADAARRCRFTPTLLLGRPVKVSGIINYNFTLR